MSLLVRIGGVTAALALACVVGFRCGGTKHHVPVALTTASVPAAASAPAAPSSAPEAPTTPLEPEGQTPPEPGIAAPRAEPPRPKVDVAHVQLCPDIRVRGIIASADQRWSFAFLSSPGAPAAVVRTGEIYARRRVAHVNADRVWFSSLNPAAEPSMCRAELFGPSPFAEPPRAAPAMTPTPAAPAQTQAPTPPPVPAPPPSAAVAVDQLPPNIRQGIRSREPGTYEIDRAARDFLVQPEMLARSVRAVPDENGAPRFTHIRPGSIAEAMGLRPGDVFQRSNGTPIANPDEILQALGKLGSGESVHFEGTRDGRPLQLDYKLQ